MTVISLLRSIDSELAGVQIDAERRPGIEPLQVEVNLNTASDLLSRCVADRTTYNSLRAQYALLDLELQQEKHELEAEEARLSEHEFSFYRENKKRAALLDSTLRNQDENQKHRKDYASKLFGAQTANFEPYWHAGVTKYEIDNDCARHDFERTAAERNLALASDEFVRLEASIRARRSRYDDKLKLVTGDEAALAYSHQASALASQIVRDHTEAVDRLCAASKGLVEVFGYSAPFEREYVAKDEPKALKPVDRAIRWARNATSWLNTFAQGDQSSVVSLSLRQEMNNSSFSDLLGGAFVQFSVKPELFEDLHCLRLRGVSLWPKASTEVLASCVVHAPRKAVTGRTGAPTLEQGSLVCTLGSVRNLPGRGAPDIAGSISLANASPIGDVTAGDAGKWGIQIRHVALGSAKSIEDLVLEIHVVGQRPTAE